MDLTVITPVYKGERFLRETINSVLSQSFKNFNYVIINDGSPDNSEKIISETNDSRIFYIKQYPNQGKANALNTALSMTKTPLVTFLDQDDVLCEKSLEKRVNLMKDNPDLDLIYGDYYFMDKDSKVYGIRKVMGYDNHEELFKATLTRGPFMFSTTMLKKSLIDKYGGFDESYKVAEDLEFFLRASRNGTKIMSVKEPVMNYRCHKNNFSKIFRKSGETKKQLFRLVDKYANGSISLKAYHLVMENLKLLFEQFSDKKIEYNPFNYLIQKR